MFLTTQEYLAWLVIAYRGFIFTQVQETLPFEHSGSLAMLYVGTIENKAKPGVFGQN